MHFANTELQLEMEIVPPVGQIAHDDPGDGEDDDEGGPGQDLVLPALAGVAPDTPRHTLALRLQH